MSDTNGTIGQYSYDGDGKRIKKYVPDTGETTMFVYDAGGKLIQEHSTVVQPVQDAKTVFTTNDHLGSPRINTDATGQVISRHDYHPFGEEIDRTSFSYGSDTIRKQFTGYERDGETGLDFAQARYYSKDHGRFASADPLYLEFNRLGFPQAMNLYAYVRNNPLRFVDLNGLDISVLGERDAVDYYEKKFQSGLGFGTKLVNSKFAIVNKDGVQITDKKELKNIRKGLSTSDKQVFDAILDTKTNATITAYSSNDGVDIGRNVSAGNNAVDTGEMQMVDQANVGLSAGEVAKHEAMEAYLTAGGQSAAQAHFSNPFSGVVSNADNFAFGGLKDGTYTTNVTSSILTKDVNFSGVDSKGLESLNRQINGASYRIDITKTYNTPIPANAITQSAVDGPGRVTSIVRRPK